MDYDNEKKYRILQVHNFYQIPGGEDSVVSNEKKMLEDHGHTVIQYLRNNSELKDFSTFRKLLFPFISIFNIKTYMDIKQLIKKHQIDIIHVHNTLHLISPAVYYAAIKCRIPIVQTIHNFRLLCMAATFYRDGLICEDCLEHGLKCAIKHRCYRGSRVQTIISVINTRIHRMTKIYGKLYYICLTEFNKEKLLNLKQIKPERIFVKPNFTEGSNEIIEYEKRPNQFVFAGRLDELKGVDILLEAWKQMGETAPKLLIYGTGPMEDWCNAFINEYGLQSVSMMGFVENKKVMKLIANSKALILPSRGYEGFPMTIVEAYSVGTPVVGTNIGNVATLIRKGITGELFDIKAAESIVDAIRRIENSQYDQNLMTKAYTKKDNYLKLMEIFSSLV